MRLRTLTSAAAALAAAACLAPGASAAPPTARGPRVAVARTAPHATLAPIPIDSLRADSTARFMLYALDMATVQLAHRELLGAANQFRRYVGEFPPRISVAALGTLGDPARVDHAALRAAGVTLIADDWPARPVGAAGSSRLADAADAIPLADRAGRAFLREYERANARVDVPAGRAHLVPDWFEAAMGGLALSPIEQNRRIGPLRDRLDRRIPFARLFTMARPAAPAIGASTKHATAGAKRGAGRAASAASAAETPEIFDAESVALARFIAARETERLIGDILQTYLRGQPETLALNAAQNLYSRPDVLEQAWVEWMKATDFPN